MTEAFDGNFVQLIRTLDAARHKLRVSRLPEDLAWTIEEIDTLQAIRTASLQLALEADKTIALIMGKIT